MNNYFSIIFSALIISFNSINSQPNYFEISKSLEILNSVFQELNIYYVDEPQPGELMETAIEAMLETLDPYTTFIPESDIEDFRFQTTGEYGGIGSLITKHNDYVWIAEPYKGFPADNSGLKIGDKIIKIGDVSVKGKNVEDVSTLLKGEPGTEINLSINRLQQNLDGELEEATIPINITREKITISSIPYYGIINLNSFFDDKLKTENYKCAYIKLDRFTRGCAADVRNALLDLESQSELDNIILDLRFNPGGLLNEAVELCNLFIPKDQIVVSTKGRNSDWDKIYKTKKTAYDTEKPIIILVNEGSASASEIVAGTIQDLDRGVVIGGKTFGKGLVQQTRKIDYNCQLKVTVAKYYTPSGRCIQKINYADSKKIMHDSLRTEFKTSNGRSVFDGGGVEPDIYVADSLENIIFHLRSKRLFFDFGNQYYPIMEEINNPIEFNVSEEIFTDFLVFLDTQEFEFETESEKQLKLLKDVTELENYNISLEDGFKNIENILSDLKKEDLFKFKKEISHWILEDLILRSHYDEGKITATLKFDKYIIEALKLFADESEYFKILNLN